jgi:pimeloyl-ACP methyl ester carboxylesterase
MTQGFPLAEHFTRTPRHGSFYLACGEEGMTPIIFVHGWPELSISWRGQLPVFAGLGFRAIAPDMRGYGRSDVPRRPEDYALEHIVGDMIELLDGIGGQKAIWVGHDWGAPVVWAIAQHHPERCHAVANLCVPYIPEGFTARSMLPLVDRSIYPKDKFPFAQWDYHLFYKENFERATAGFEADVRATVRTLFRAGGPSGRGKPSVTAFVRANGGWFGPNNRAPARARDDRVMGEDEEDQYVAALERTGFSGPDSWYMNGEANAAYAEKARTNWRLTMPVLFLHAAYDYVCETIDSRLAEPMRAHCADLTEAVVRSGHWMAQEKPACVNATLAKWLAQKKPELWLSSQETRLDPPAKLTPAS